MVDQQDEEFLNSQMLSIYSEIFLNSIYSH